MPQGSKQQDETSKINRQDTSNEKRFGTCPINAEGLFDYLSGIQAPYADRLISWLDCHRHMCKHVVGLLPEPSELLSNRALYSVRLVLDADCTSVEHALEDALIHGMPGKLDAELHGRLFSVPPPMTTEWKHALGSGMRIMPEAGRRELATLQHAAAIPMGLRPLGPEEFTEAIKAPSGWACFHHVARRLIMGDPTSKRYFSCTDYMHSIICTTQHVPEKQNTDDFPSRIFMVYVCSAQLGGTMSVLRNSGRLVGTQGGLYDFAFVLRCFVRDVKSNEGGKRRTELVRELVDGIPMCMSGKDHLEIVKASAPVLTRDIAELMLKNYAWILEEEGRIWSAANGFDVVEAWRGVRRAEPSILSSARNIAAVYCLSPGEGAAAVCECNSAGLYSEDRLRKLSSQFPCREVHQKHRPLNSEIDSRGQFAEGSIDITSFVAVIDRICRRARPEADIFRRFVDLGSGEGLAVIAVHQLFDFRSCIGIELVEELVERSRQRAMSLEDGGVAADDLFVRGDIFADQPDWSDGSVVFCNAATWPIDLIEKLGYFAQRLRPGSVLVLLNNGRQFPPCSGMLDKFDFHVEAAFVSWQDVPEKLWVFQRL